MQSTGLQYIGAHLIASHCSTTLSSDVFTLVHLVVFELSSLDLWSCKTDKSYGLLLSMESSNCTRK